MRRIVLAALLLGSAVVVTPAADAQSGFLCGFASITDPTLEGDVQTGEIDGGPLLARDGDNPGEETADISIRCTIQVGAQGATHAGADAYTAEGPTTPAVAELAPHQFSYVAPEGAPVYLCTEAEVNGQIRYFNETEDDATRGWSTSSSSLCALAISQEIDGGPLELPAEAVVIIGGLAPGSEPTHTNVDGWACNTYSWSGGVYDVTCTSAAFSTCHAVAVTAIGQVAAVRGTSRCTGLSTSAVSPGANANGGLITGSLPLHCVADESTTSQTGARPWIVVCAVAAT